jgi:hypothetical protein
MVYSFPETPPMAMVGNGIGKRIPITNPKNRERRETREMNSGTALHAGDRAWPEAEDEPGTTEIGATESFYL